MKTAETILPRDLGSAERKHLVRELYHIHSGIFSGLTEDEFGHYVVESPATATKIHLYRDKYDKQVVGYFAVHRFELQAQGRDVVVFRGEAGLLATYRRLNADLSFFLREILWFKLTHPSSEVYFLASPVNPSMYAILARYLWRVYPRHDLSIPPRTKEIMLELGQQFGLKATDAREWLNRRVGWIAQAGENERNFWQRTENPHIRFYMRHAPNFIEGNGLLMLVPFNFFNLFLSIMTFSFYTLRKKIFSVLRPTARWSHAH